MVKNRDFGPFFGHTVFSDFRVLLVEISEVLPVEISTIRSVQISIFTGKKKSVGLMVDVFTF